MTADAREESTKQRTRGAAGGVSASRRQLFRGVRTRIAIGCVVAGIVAALSLGLDPRELSVGPGSWRVAGAFMSRALSPALVSEARFVPAGTPPLLVLAGSAAVDTLVLAAAAMAPALLVGLLLGFLASTAWWEDSLAGAEASGWRLRLRSGLLPAFYLGVRALIAALRSIHELIWAVIFLAAVGLTPMAAVWAIALPFAGVLAKVFSEIIDEVPRDGARALAGAGASDLQVLCFGLLPVAFPEMLAYAFYRFECALRSAAILGFFGFTTLGLYIRQSFQSTNYGEVWTFLYVMVALVLLFEAWSGRVRRRIRVASGASVRSA